MAKPMARMERQKAVAWVKRLVALCPYDSTQLTADSIPGWAYYECACCKRTWDMATSRDPKTKKARA